MSEEEVFTKVKARLLLLFHSHLNFSKKDYYKIASDIDLIATPELPSNETSSILASPH